ncbi:MAG TPA: ABC transporter ATP-binding protein, partial [Vicinamibacterales bacterium]|nr:ABC transporter ATP-binding protein [Vicinamibacterales bacterium]
MLKIRRLSKTFSTSRGSVSAVEAVELDIDDGEFLALLGPSGSGKSTMLRCVAGLDEADDGEIRIGDTVVTDVGRGVYVPAYQRDIGMVFQSYAIWPHFDVFTNVAYPLQVRRPRSSEGEISAKVMHALELVGMQDFARRRATTLSGGEQQRIALARALVRRPRLLLLDEPLANLDARLRAEMQREISDLVRGLRITTLSVTHDQTEAMAMADRIAVMESGRVIECDTPRALYARPRTAFVASFLGAENVLAGTVESVRSDSMARVVLDSDAGRLLVHLRDACSRGERIDVAIHAEDLTIVQDATCSADNLLSGTVVRIVFRGAALECHVQVGARILKATLPAAFQDDSIGVGE